MSSMEVTSPCGPTETLNERCFCASLDRGALLRHLETQLNASSAGDVHEAIRTDFFADVPLFVRRTDMATMEQVVRSIDALARMPEYIRAISPWMPQIARLDPGPIGVFMGHDFHLTEAGPRLIEINTNAGGAFLNAELARAQRACCREVEQAIHSLAELESFEDSVVEMFESEWRRQRGAGRAARIAIVDDDPQTSRVSGPLGAEPARGARRRCFDCRPGEAHSSATTSSTGGASISSTTGSSTSTVRLRTLRCAKPIFGRRGAHAESPWPCVVRRQTESRRPAMPTPRENGPTPAP
jgi:hypothetical protein